MGPLYFQCRLRRDDTETVAWIEERGATVGAFVELLPARDLWEVIRVGGPGLAKDKLREHQLMHRGSLPSVQWMA